MKEITLQIPVLEAEQNIEIDVRINGRRQVMKYRVEIVEFEADAEQKNDSVALLKQVIREHDPDWQLIQIGAPLDHKIPVTFRQKQLAQ
ncbi:MAG: hypothetical protein NTW95_12075 [Candidatus Aminicenantes bacterium]|jgi:hypothetical protein|nr:hypothetical protein [Candidatus Aminicenantes bacterium]